jgi:predicted porin
MAPVLLKGHEFDFFIVPCSKRNFLTTCKKPGEVMQSKFPLVKLLLSAAIAAAFASPAMAQTSVNVEGIADMYVGSMKNSGDTGRVTRMGSGGMSTSYLGFKGVEDLGGGLKASFTLGAFFQLDSGTQGRFGNDTLFSRDANVALSGNFGALTLGRMISPTTLPAFLFNPIGDSFTFSPLILHKAVPTTGWASTFAGDTGWSNSIRYTTPSFGGLTANLYYQPGEVAAAAGKKNVGGNVLYFNGPLSLTAAYHDVQVNNPTDALGVTSNVNRLSLTGASVPFTQNAALNATEQKLWLVGGSYDFGVAKLFATYDQSKHNVADLRDKTGTLGLSVPAGGAGKILAAVAQTRRTSDAFSELRRTTYTIGYDYNLSKRTDLYTYLMNDKVTSNDNAQSFAVGVRHRF